MKQHVYQKILFLLLSAFFLTSTASAQTTITWTGATNNDWNNAGNWSSSNVPNGNDEIALFNSGGTVTIASIPTSLNLGRLRIEGNTRLELSPSLGATLRIGENAYAGSEIFVASGSTLELNSNVGMIIEGGAANAVNITGTLIAADNAFIQADSADCDFNISGTVETAELSGFSGGTGTTFRNSNSPTFIIATTSTIIYTATAIQTISSRADYGNVTLRGGPNIKTLGGNITLDGGRTLLIESDAQLSSGTLFQVSFAGTGGSVNVQGTYIVNDLDGLAGGAATSISNSNSPTITLGPSSIVRYVSSSAQEISPLSNYHEIELSGTGLKNISSGTVRVDEISLSAASGSLVLNGGDLIVDTTINSSAFGGVVIRPSSAASDVIIDAKGGSDLTVQIEGGTRTMRSLTLTSESGLIEIVSTSGALNLTISAFLDLAGSNLEIDANTTLITPSVDTNLENYLGGAGSFSLSPVGTFRVGSIDGITTGTTSGSLRVSGTRTFTTNSLISYTRNGSQSSGNAITGLTGTSGCNVLIDDFTTVTLAGSATMLSGRTFTVNGSLFTFDFTISGAGSFLLEDSGTLGIGAAAGLNTGASGNIQVTGTRTYNLGATVLFCRNGAQNIGNSITTNMNVTVSDSTTATVNNNITIGTGLLFLTRGKLTIPSANTLTGSGSTFTLNSNGILEFQGATAIQSGGQLNFGTRNLNNSGSKIIFNSNSAQTFGTSFPSAIQKFRKEGSGTLSGEPSLTIADSAEFIGGAVDFSNGAVTLNGVISGSGALSSNNTGSLTIGGAGSISNTLTTPAELENLTLNRTGQTFTLSQSLQVGSTVEGGTLTLTNGTVRVNSGSTLTIGNNFSRTNGFINTTAGAGRVRFNDNTTLVLPAATFTSNRVYDLSLETTGSISLTGGDLQVENNLTLNFGSAANRFLVNTNTLTLNGSLTTTTGRLDLSDGTLEIGGTGNFTLNPESFDSQRIRRLRLTRNGNVVANGIANLLLQDLELSSPSASNEFQIGAIPRLQFDQIGALPSIARTQGSIEAASGTVQFIEGLTVPENTFKNDVIFGCEFQCNNINLTLNGSLRITNNLLMNPNFAIRQIIVGDSLRLDGTLTYTQGSVNVGANKTLVNNGVASFPNGFFTSNQVGNFVVNRSGGTTINSNLTVLAGDTLLVQTGNLTVNGAVNTLTINGVASFRSNNQVTGTGAFALGSGAVFETQNTSGYLGTVTTSTIGQPNSTNIVVFNGTGNQNINFFTIPPSFPIGGLLIRNTGVSPNNVVTLNRNIEVTDTLSIESGVFSDGNGTLTYSSGKGIRNQTEHRSIGSGRIEMTNSAASQIITGGGVFGRLQIPNGSGVRVRISANTTIDSLIQNGAGQLSLNGFTLTLNNGIVGPTVGLHNDNAASSLIFGNALGGSNLIVLSPIQELQNLTIGSATRFLNHNLTVSNTLNLTGLLNLDVYQLTISGRINSTTSGAFRGSSSANIFLTGANVSGDSLKFDAGFQNLNTLFLQRSSLDTVILATPLTASSVTLRNGLLLNGNNLNAPATLTYDGGQVSPPPSTATDVSIQNGANGQTLLLPSPISGTLSTGSGNLEVSIENDVITNNFSFGNRTVFNMLGNRVLTVNGIFTPDLSAAVPSRVTGRLRMPVGTSDKVWHIGDATKFRPVVIRATSGSGNATARLVPNDSLPAPAQAGLGSVAGVANRYWDIDATGGITADIAFNYNSDEFTVFDEAAMQIYRWTGAVWDKQTKFSQDLANDTIRITNVSSFSPFLATTTEDAPLPVSLTTFTGVSTNAGVRLSWETGTEQDNLGFEIRREHDGLSEAIAHYRDTPALRGRGTTLEPTKYAYIDARTEQGKTYRYALRSFDLNGTIHEYSDKAIEVFAAEFIKPSEFALAQNFPNPFNPTTIIQYQLSENSLVKLELYDITGRKVATLVNAWQNAGYHSFSLNGSIYNLSSGMYFYRLNAGNFVQTKKMMLLK